MNKTKGEISRRELLKMASPLGRVTLDKDACTGCGLCALDCPTGALTLSSGEADVYQLLFRHSLCFACNQCAEVCPEKCLSVERTLETDGLNRPAVVLFEDEIVRCAGCGRPFASRATINNIKRKVLATGRAIPATTLELCPECKVKAQFGQPGN